MKPVFVTVVAKANLRFFLDCMKILKMDSRRLSATIGFSLLIGCVIAVITVIYNGSSARTSYRASVEESWRKREIKLKVRLEMIRPETQIDISLKNIL